MSGFVWDVASLATLRKQWERGLRFGVLMAPLHPTPASGDRAEVRIRCTWEGVSFEVSGAVVQASTANSVVQLDPLSDAARRTLVKVGLDEAAGAPAAPVAVPAPAPPPTAAAEPEPSPPPAVEPEPAPVAPAEPRPVAAAPAREPEPPAAPAAPAPAPPRAPSSVAFSPPAARPRSAGFTPPAARPRSAGVAPTAARPDRAATASRPAPAGAASSGPAAVDKHDLNRVASAAGPATLSSEALLPPAAQHGDFATVTWRDVLLHFFEKKVTGVLAIEAFREVRWCYVVDGKPVHYLGDKPHPGEFLSDALIADGVVTAAQWARALRVQKLTGVLAGDYLVSTGVLTRQALDSGLARRAERITRNLMGMNFGNFRFHDFPEVRGVFTFKPVDVLAVLLRAQRESLAAVDDDRLVQQVEGYYPLHVRPVAARKALMAQLPLTDEEMRLVTQIVPASWTLGELVALREMEERRLVRLLFGLKALGMIEFVRDEGLDGKRNRAERILYIGLRDLQRRNGFEALHSHWSSSPEELEAGYNKLLEEFGATRFAKVRDARIDELVSAIREAADATWARLKDREGRRNERKKVVGVDQLRMASDLLDKQGVMASFKSDFRLVKACYERVRELDPGGPEGVENLRRAKEWLKDQRVMRAQVGADMGDMQDQLDALL